jgi:hypothetical protein
MVNNGSVDSVPLTHQLEGPTEDEGGTNELHQLG